MCFLIFFDNSVNDARESWFLTIIYPHLNLLHDGHRRGQSWMKCEALVGVDDGQQRDECQVVSSSHFSQFSSTTDNSPSIFNFYTILHLHSPMVN